MMLNPVGFEQLYTADDDPFQISTSWYEQRKIATALAALGRRRYHRTWDTACGTGHLTKELAGRSDYLVASDAAPRACTLTRDRLSGVGSTQVAVHALPAELPDSADAPFDLVVLSEVLYYLPATDRAEMAGMLTRSTTGDQAEILAVDWRHQPDDAAVSGAAASRQLDSDLRELGWRLCVEHLDDHFVLRSWKRPERSPGDQ